MPPTLALFLWFVLLLALLRFDPAKEPGTSVALWVPLIWLFILGSRLPSQWLGGEIVIAAAELEEGNSLNRNIYFVLILLSIGILMSRPFQWSHLFAQNFVLIAFLSFCLLSALWSDFPVIALKRFIRDLGSYLVILVALSDPRPLVAVRTLFRRLCYLLIPLSILLIKYYPEKGQGFDFWTGAPEYIGAATSKNMLGLLCLVSGLYFFWDTLARWVDRKEPLTRRIILVNAAFIVMTLWLLNLASSATSSICLALGCAVIAAAHSKTVRQHPSVLKALIPIGGFLYLMLAFGFGIDIKGEVAEAVGRDPTLTDRTLIWETLLDMRTNPLVGAGYESFWLGSRLSTVWSSGFGINQAHNGYLQTYLNLGIIGLALLLSVYIASCRIIFRRTESPGSIGWLSLATCAVLAVYNVTESALHGGLLWFMFLSGVVVVVSTRHGVKATQKRAL